MWSWSETTHSVAAEVEGLSSARGLPPASVLPPPHLMNRRNPGARYGLRREATAPRRFGGSAGGLRGARSARPEPTRGTSQSGVALTLATAVQNALRRAKVPSCGSLHPEKAFGYPLRAGG